MNHISDDEWRRLFSVWLRTGRLKSVRNANGIELKFNPWHEPETGRFTFVGSGRYFGQGGERAGTTSSQSAQSPRPDGKDPSARNGWGGGGFTRGGGGSFGGAGASGSWGPGSAQDVSEPSSAARALAPRHSSTRTAQLSVAKISASQTNEQVRTVVRNGYTYEIDKRNRTRHVFGVLTMSEAPVRSRTAQARAGGADRRASDDGGHYIAARFNGPTEAFNHFAQDAHVNRGRYRLLEDQWASAKRKGKKVTVNIAPRFDGKSARPFEIDIGFTIDGNEQSVKLPNERTDKSHGR